MTDFVEHSAQNRRRRRKLPSVDAAIVRSSSALVGENSPTRNQGSFGQSCSSRSASDSGVASPVRTSQASNAVALDDIVVCTSPCSITSAEARSEICQECYTSEALMHCAYCSLVLCLKCCEDIHRRQSFREHVPTYMQQLVTTKDSRVSLNEENLSHDAISSDTDNLGTRQMRDSARQLRKLRDLWKSDARSLKRVAETISADHMKLKQQIQSHFEALRRILDTRELYLQQDVDAKYAVRLKLISAQQKKISQLNATSKKQIRQAHALEQAIATSTKQSCHDDAGCPRDLAEYQTTFIHGKLSALAVEVDVMIQTLDAELKLQRLERTSWTTASLTQAKLAGDYPVSFACDTDMLSQCISTFGKLL
eukprot:m.513780 g.513780  ORF g.513780 m.513780 type:complete len:367 (+) comp21907_c0_seq6:423-1523(+)